MAFTKKFLSLLGLAAKQRAEKRIRNTRRRALKLEGLEGRQVMAAGDLLISEFMADPTGTDIGTEYVELIATRDINFATTNYSVIWTRNGTATSAGWKTGASITYGFNLTSGIVKPGDIFYVGGTLMAPTGLKLATYDHTSPSAGADGLGFGSPTGMLGDGGPDADSIAVFDMRISAVTSSTEPIDAIFYGTGTGSAVVNAGADGYQLPVNDRYSGGKLQTTSFVALNPVEGSATIATGSYLAATNTYPTIRTWSNGAHTATSAVNLKPLVVSNPADTMIDWSSNATFTASAVGNPTPSIQWQVSTDSGENWSNLANGGVYSGVTTTTLSLTKPPVSLSNNQYRATFSNAEGTVESLSATLTVNAVPVNYVYLNGSASGQRSQVTSLVLNFQSPVTLAASDLELLKLSNLDLSGPSAAVTTLLLSTPGPATTFTITFGSGTSVINRAAPGGGNSLADGNYQLTIAGNNNYQFGDEFNDKFFRMFGDADGDGDVDGSDSLKFRQALSVYNPALDWDGGGQVTNGSVDSSNFAANNGKKRRQPII